VPLDRPKSATVALHENSDTEFGQLASGWRELHGKRSGFFPLVYGMEAMGARLDMVNGAERTIDLQYFLMKDDSAGSVIAEALVGAANRGVRIRFLLDDVFTSAPDSDLIAINAHPNIEVRLFNPISRRGLHSLNFVGHFRRANRRMHNKSFTVDNAISIVGGRNIADEYFQLKTDSVFSDFDVLAFGPVVKQISASFDDYWNHELAVPMAYFAEGIDGEQALTALVNPPDEKKERNQAIYDSALAQRLVRELAAGSEQLFVADAKVIADSPHKLNRAVGGDNMQLATELGEILSNADSELIFINPYYVPGKDGVEFVDDITNKGVDVVIVTNSLASTNHIPVHSAYAGYRRDVLDTGVALYEVRANAGREAQGGTGPAQLTLHTKLIIIDRRYVFVGSLNLDPRSLEINAEMGLLIDSPELASLIADGLMQDLEHVAYQVIEGDRGLEWHATIDGQQIVETSEPLSSNWRRLKAWVMRIAPEGQL